MLSIRVLGDFELEVEGKRLERPTPHRFQSLIAWLLLRADVPSTRLQLAAAFWPDAPDEQARGNLRKVLHDLRKVLPELEPFIRTDKHRIWWVTDGHCSSDVEAFEHAARQAESDHTLDNAIAMYRGELLPECYDEWVLPVRERLHETYLRLLHMAISAAEERREYLRAATYVESMLSDEPLQEELYRTLMRLHALAGDRPAALRVYHRCAMILERELHVQPSSATVEAYEMLLEKPAARPPIAVSPRLIGRDTEWQRLQEAWRAANRGRSAAVLLTGEPGIGKTRLLEEFSTWAQRQGMHTLYARCYEMATGLAYAPVTALLRSSPLPSLDRIWLAEIARILPELASERADLPMPGPMSESWQRIRLFDALTQAVLASEPLLLVLDDLQWADTDSIDWLHYLLRSHPTARLLVVGATRPEGLMTDRTRPALWTDLRQDMRLEEIEIYPLDLPATTEFVMSYGNVTDTTEIRKLWDETEGNPLFLLESLRAQAADPGSMPASIVFMLGARLGRLSPDAQELAQSAAVIGREFSLSTLAAAWPSAEQRLVAALDELWGGRIIRERGSDAYDFTHDKLRQVTYDSLHVGRKQLLHRQVGQALETAVRGDLNSLSPVIAQHFDAAGDGERAASWHLRAGDAARRVFANQAALEHYERAAERLPAERAFEATLRLGELLVIIGEFSKAEHVYRAGMRRATENGNALAEARCRLGLGELFVQATRLDEAIPEIEGTLTVFGAYGQRELIGAAMCQLGLVHVQRGKYDSAATLLGQAASLAAEAGNRQAELLSVRSLAYLHVLALQLDDAEPYLHRQLRLGEELGQTRHRVSALINLGLVHGERGEYLRAADTLCQGYELGLSSGYTATKPTALINLGLMYRRLGHSHHARRCWSVSAAIAGGAGLRHHASVALYLLGHQAASEGRLQEAERLLPPAVDFLETVHLAFNLSEARYLLADLRERQGDFDEASRLAGRAHEIATEIGRHDYIFVSQVLAIRLDVARGVIDAHRGCERLATMLPEWPQSNRQAALRYAAWRLDPSHEEDRLLAARLYADIHPSRPNALYRERYHELTGRHLAAPDVPELPGDVRDYPGSTDELIESVVQSTHAWTWLEPA